MDKLNPRAVAYAERRARGQTMQEAAYWTSIAIMTARWLETLPEVQAIIRRGRAVVRRPSWLRPAETTARVA
jgi:hypothetical protein